jgi:hypothetical protein
MRGERTNPSAARTKIGAVIVGAAAAVVARARAVAGSEIGIGAGEAAAAAAIVTNATGMLSATWRPCLFFRVDQVAMVLGVESSASSSTSLRSRTSTRMHMYQHTQVCSMYVLTYLTRVL